MTDEVAARTGEKGLTPSFISQLERGIVGYSQRSLELLAEVYECEAGDLLSYHPESVERRRRLAGVADEELDKLLDVMRILGPHNR